ncbi:hypothetical protein J4434_01695 [Candidatus Woesearchaeota archaeon]|nr:hypothetical protein [Candidatus Woesearchaeota archaeon]
MQAQQVQITQFYAQEAYEPLKAGVPYKPQKFYADVKLEEPVGIEELVDYIVDKLKTATKNECINAKRIPGGAKFSFIDYMIKEAGYTPHRSDIHDKTEGDNSFPKLEARPDRTLLYISGSMLPSDYYHIEGYPSYETVRVLANVLRGEGIKESKTELKKEEEKIDKKEIKKRKK